MYFFHFMDFFPLSLCSTIGWSLNFQALYSSALKFPFGSTLCFWFLFCEIRFFSFALIVHIIVVEFQYWLLWNLYQIIPTSVILVLESNNYFFFFRCKPIAFAFNFVSYILSFFLIVLFSLFYWFSDSWYEKWFKKANSEMFGHHVYEICILFETCYGWLQLALFQQEKGIVLPHYCQSGTEVQFVTQPSWHLNTGWDSSLLLLGGGSSLCPTLGLHRYL
jgi:hypothetical protein